MKSATTYHGQVTCDTHHRSSYVRVRILRPGSSPLVIKARFEGFSQEILTEGTWVELWRTNHCDATQYSVRKVFGDMFNTYKTTRSPTDLKMSENEGSPEMSPNSTKDRVKFFLPNSHFQIHSKPSMSSTMDRETCKNILGSVFKMDWDESGDLMRGNPDGFHIVCTQQQFAHFIILRHNTNTIVNGIRNLKPELIKEFDIYSEISRSTKVARDDVKRVIIAYGYSNKPVPAVNYLDVSTRTHTHPKRQRHHNE